jgi:predicted lipid-binding transport protein (Tim44 family)
MDHISLSVIWVASVVDQAKRSPRRQAGGPDFPPGASAGPGPHHIQADGDPSIWSDQAMSRPGLNWRVILALLCCAFLSLMPALAEARGGGSFGGRPSSMGSRGSRSWENNGAQPLNRSLTPQPQSPGRPGYSPGPAYPASGGSFFQRHPFLTGLAGGAVGSWLFGHGANAQGAGGGAGSAIGTLVWIALIAALVWFGVRLFRRGSPSSGWPGGAAGRVARSAGAAAAGPDRGRDVNLADGDLQSFQQLHAAIQEAWSAGDLSRLQRLMTPEMLSYFSDELTRNASRGVRNVVSDVRLVKGELTESWQERDRQYATAFLHWRAIDYVVGLGGSAGEPANIVAGDFRTPVEAEEIWTFVRPRGGAWLLSAIQQV